MVWVHTIDRESTNDRLIRQRGFFSGMVLILAVRALTLVWQFNQSILLVLLVILKPMYNRFLEGNGSREAQFEYDIFYEIRKLCMGNCNRVVTGPLSTTWAL